MVNWIHCNLPLKCNYIIQGAEIKWRLTQCRLILCAVQFSSLKTETERIQAQKDQLQAELLASRTELDGLRVALSHVQNTNKALTSDKVNPVSLVFIHWLWVNSGGRGNNWSGLWMSGEPESTVPGAAQPSDQPAFPGRHQSDGTEGLRSALPVTAGSWADQKDLSNF